MADDRQEVAIDTIARRMVKFRGWHREGADRDDYPALTQEQWDAIDERVDAYYDQLNPSEDDFVAAYEYLTGQTP